MPACVSRSTILVMLTWCLVLFASRTATAQLLCPEADARPLDEAGVLRIDSEILRAPKTITVEADVRALGDSLPGGTWRMPSSSGFDCDGLALEGVAFTRHTTPALESSVHMFDVVIDLRARPRGDDIAAALELVVTDGERRLRLGSYEDIRLHAGEAMRVSRTISIAKDDFVAFFAGGATPTLRVTRWIPGC